MRPEPLPDRVGATLTQTRIQDHWLTINYTSEAPGMHRYAVGEATATAVARYVCRDYVPSVEIGRQQVEIGL